MQRLAGAVADRRPVASDPGDGASGSDFTLGTSFVRSQASLHVVPSFDGFDATVDVRVVKLDDGNVVTTPMVLAVLRTDVSDQRLVFQLTRRDVGVLIEQLKTLDEQLVESSSIVVEAT